MYDYVCLFSHKNPTGSLLTDSIVLNVSVARFVLHIFSHTINGRRRYEIHTFWILFMDVGTWAFNPETVIIRFVMAVFFFFHTVAENGPMFMLIFSAHDLSHYHIHHCFLSIILISWNFVYNSTMHNITHMCIWRTDFICIFKRIHGFLNDLHWIQSIRENTGEHIRSFG